MFVFCYCGNLLRCNSDSAALCSRVHFFLKTQWKLDFFSATSSSAPELTFWKWVFAWVTIHLLLKQEQFWQQQKNKTFNQHTLHTSQHWIQHSIYYLLLWLGTNCKCYIANGDKSGIQTLQAGSSALIVTWLFSASLYLKGWKDRPSTFKRTAWLTETRRGKYHVGWSSTDSLFVLSTHLICLGEEVLLNSSLWLTTIAYILGLQAGWAETQSDVFDWTLNYTNGNHVLLCLNIQSQIYSVFQIKQTEHALQSDTCTHFSSHYTQAEML